MSKSDKSDAKSPAHLWYDVTMKIIRDSLSLGELQEMASGRFGNMVKVVADIDRGLLAVDAELHSDLEALLLQDGSKQKNLWGINLYPEILGDDFLEFDSMINLRPSQGNSSRGVENEAVRAKISALVQKTIAR
jgi:hypothetical protein